MNEQPPATGDGHHWPGWGALREPDESGQLVQLLLESTGQGLYGQDLQGRCTFANRASAQLLGYDDPDELLGAEMHQLIHHTRPDGSPYPYEECRIRTALRDEHGVHSDEEVLFRRDGTSFPADYQSHPVRRDGEVIGAVVTFSDVTAQREAQLRLHASEARFRGLFNAAKTGISMNTLEGRYVAANPAFCAMVGYTEAEVTSMDFVALTHPEDRQYNRELFQQLLAGDIPNYRMEKRYLRKDGDAIWVDLAVSLVRDEDGQPLHTVATMEDITPRKNAEQRLQRSQALQRVAGSLARVGGWAIDVWDNRVTWSDEVFEIFEITDADPGDLSIGLSRYPPPHRQRIAAAVEACSVQGTPFDLEVQAETFKGNRRWLRVVAEPERDVDGTVTRVIGAVQDITEQRRANEETERLAERLTTTLESITDAFLTLDREWRLTHVNQRAEELLRRPRREMLGRSIWEALPEAAGGPLHQRFDRALREGTTEVIEEYHLTRMRAWFTIRAYPSAQGLAVYVQDVTEQRRARMELLDREARLAEQAALLDKAHDAIVVRDLDHRITYVNPSAEQLYGWPAAEIMGRSSRDLYPDSADFDAAMETLMRNGEWDGELALRHRSGTPLVVESRWTLVRDDDGRPRSVLVIDTDVTERTHLEAQLLRAQRMESVGTLAGGLAHDLNNALTPIMMSTGLLQLDETDDARRALLDTITTSTARAADMVRQILSFARGVEGRREAVDIDALLTDVHRIAEDTFLKTIQIVREDTIELWPVIGDPTQLHQVLINLCVNARDAMSDGGTLRLATDAVIVDEQYAALSHGATPGPYVRICVEDDGEGMAPEVLDRIFEPFYTTKDQGHGTGLGLSITVGIIRSHGGFIRVYSELGQGTRFLVHLPAAVDAAADPAPPTTSALPRGADELVLLVDDEPQIRTVLGQTLESFGYRVLLAGGGPEAVQLFEQRAADIDVVLTDMMMPGMDGPATILAMRGVRSDVPIIAASGLHSQVDVAKASELGVQHFLPKPCSISQMLLTIKEVIEADRAAAPPR